MTWTLSAPVAFGLTMHSGKPYIVVDTKVEGVVLPDYLMEEDEVTLNFPITDGHPSVDDLVADLRGISTVLTFGREPFAISIPWIAITCVHDGNGRGWVRDDTKIESSIEPKKKFTVIQGDKK